MEVGHGRVLSVAVVWTCASRILILIVNVDRIVCIFHLPLLLQELYEAFILKGQKVLHDLSVDTLLDECHPQFLHQIHLEMINSCCVTQTGEFRDLCLHPIYRATLCLKLYVVTLVAGLCLVMNYRRAFRQHRQSTSILHKFIILYLLYHTV